MHHSGRAFLLPRAGCDLHLADTFERAWWVAGQPAGARRVARLADASTTELCGWRWGCTYPPGSGREEEEEEAGRGKNNWV